MSGTTLNDNINLSLDEVLLESDLSCEGGFYHYFQTNEEETLTYVFEYSSGKDLEGDLILTPIEAFPSWLTFEIIAEQVIFFFELEDCQNAGTFTIKFQVEDNGNSYSSIPCFFNLDFEALNGDPEASYSNIQVFV